MKYLPLIFVFSLMFLTACQESSSKKSSSSNQNNYCAQNPWAYGCNGNPNGGNTACYSGNNYYCMQGCPGYGQYPQVCGNNNNNNTCYSGNNYYCVQGCPGYGQFPQVCGGTTAGGSTGGSTPPTNSCPGCPTQPYPQGWGVKYPAGIPAESCQPAYAPSGISYTPYETRKATMTIVGKQWYNPASPDAPNYMNTSSILKSVQQAKTFFATDSILKVRFKPKPQPESSNSSPYCYGRSSGSSIAGYTKLMFNVELVGTRANGSTAVEPLGTHMVQVNSCTPALDLSSYASQYPGGIYIRVSSVRSNQGPVDWDYWRYGFNNSNSFADVRSSDCWVIDVEVAADGTKTFD